MGDLVFTASKMRMNSPSTWFWASIETYGSTAIWNPLADSECSLLEHACGESWGRLEIDIEGRPYVIDPFSSNDYIHLALPVGNAGCCGLLITRTVSPAIQGQCGSSAGQMLKSNRAGRRFLVSPQDGAEGELKIPWKPGLQQSCSSSPSVPPGEVPKARQPSSLNMPVNSPDFDGFQLVCRGHRERVPTGQLTSPARKDSGKSQMAMWRHFPKVNLEAYDDYHVVRQVLVDGVDIALHHGWRRRLSPAGVAIAVAHFLELSFPVRVVVPKWIALMHKQHCNLFTESPEALLEALEEDDLLIVLPDPSEPHWYPSISRLKSASDAECTVELCKTFNAAYCSNDFNQFLQLLDSTPSHYNDYLYMMTRSCLFTFDGDNFYHVLDSLGRGQFVDKLFFRTNAT